MQPGVMTSDADRQWRGPAPLGVGLPYLPGVDPAIYRSGLLDFVEVTPDILCRPRRGAPGAILDARLLDAARAACGDLPITVHGVELSIGSAHGWNEHYVEMLATFKALWPFRWHSEHLHFQTIPDAAATGTIETGVPLPLPLTQEAVDLVAPRAARLTEMFGVPFLLENGAHYLGDLPADAEIGDEAGFHRAVAMQGNCGILLDLHNLHCNALNNGVNACALLDRFGLERVGEIHLAGGCWADGFWTDAHCGLVPEPVWDMLNRVLPLCPNVGGLLFEIMPDHARTIGSTAVLGELERARRAWERMVRQRERVPCLV